MSLFPSNTNFFQTLEGFYGCERIHAQGLGTHGQTPQTWEHGRN
jgi:hypothetical protein